jgi:alkylhydroperoxidase family enzyme
MPRKTKRPRIEPLQPPYDEGASAALPLLGPPIQLFRVFARRPKLARGIAGWGSYYLSRRSALTLRQRELVIDRTTAKCAADYEWGAHIAFSAEKVGLTAEQIGSLARGEPTDPCWSSDEAAVLGAVDELHLSHDLSDKIWARLVDAVGEDGAVELTLVCGWYHAISFAVRALRLPNEPRTPTIDAS